MTRSALLKALAQQDQKTRVANVMQLETLQLSLTAGCVYWTTRRHGDNGQPARICHNPVSHTPNGKNIEGLI